jgi:hypothetical protein
MIPTPCLILKGFLTVFQVSSFLLDPPEACGEHVNGDVMALQAKYFINDFGAHQF